jgi:UDP-N-acetylglucosamine/UDP-N-acetylgalactosamine 4-epimerase
LNNNKYLQEYFKNNQDTWLITGVAGFIGSNLLEKLLIFNQKVVGLDNFETGYQDNIKQAISDANKISGKDTSVNFKFIDGDIRNLDTCFKACKNVDFILHQAALGSVPRSIEDPISTNKANVDGFLNMLFACYKSSVKRFIYASSSATYGDHPDLPKIEEKIGEVLSPYALTKYVNELYANVFAKSYGLKSIGLRYFNVFGKRQDPDGPYAAVIPKWISSMINNEDVFINGDGETSRDFCYIDNVVQINLLSAIVDNEHAYNQVYNVALNEKTSLNELYKMIEKRLFKKLSHLKKKKPIYRDFRVGDVKHSQANIDKAKLLLRYQPRFSLSSGMDEAMDWYIKSLTS